MNRDPSIPVDLSLEQRRARSGLVSGVSAYLWWGVVPIYFKLLSAVPAVAVVSHRVVWSLLFVAGLITLRRGWRDVAAASRDPRTWIVLTASSILIAINWLTFILSIQWGMVLDSSMGYFIAPLVNVLLGVLFLKERMRLGQAVALALATAGVLVLAVDRGVFPWIALILAGSFGFYGLLRKVAPVGPLIGLLIECALLTPIGLLVLAQPAWFSLPATTLDTPTLLLLAGGGIITAVPLLLFADAARKLRMATIGFLQYIGPSVQFFIAVLVFREPFSSIQLVSFSLIWTAVLAYSADSLRGHRAARAAIAGGASPAAVDSALPEDSSERACEPS